MALEFRDNIAPYAVGRRANMEEWNAITRSQEGTANIKFGAPVVPGATRHTCKPLSAADENVLGISEASFVLGHVGDEYNQYDNVAICEAGVIGVLLGANVTAGAQARYNVTAGNWTGAAASATVLTIPGAQFEYAGSSGEVGVVRYRRPVPSVSAGA